MDHRLPAICGLMLLSCLPACRGTSSSTAKPSDSAGLERVRLQLNWFPEVEHGGYYAALVEGFFADEGLEVEIVAGGPNSPVPQLVDGGRAEFGITNADQVLLAREAGAELQAVFAALQDSPRCILVHEDAGIRDWNELRDVTLAVGSSATFFRFLAKRLPLENVEIVAYSGSIAPFLTGTRQAQQAYVFSEPLLARQQGARPVTLLVSELGFNPYTSVLVTRASWAGEHRDTVQRMVRACRRGWQHYLQQPERAHDRILRENSEMTREALDFGVAELRPLCLPQGMSPDQLGSMTAERWQELARQLAEIELVKSEPAPGTFTLEFLSESK